jgi:DNA polymerase III delta prime subunit
LIVKSHYILFSKNLKVSLQSACLSYIGLTVLAEAELHTDYVQTGGEHSNAEVKAEVQHHIDPPETQSRHEAITKLEKDISLASINGIRYDFKIDRDNDGTLPSDSGSLEDWRSNTDTSRQLTWSDCNQKGINDVAFTGEERLHNYSSSKSNAMKLALSAADLNTLHPISNLPIDTISAQDSPNTEQRHHATLQSISTIPHTPPMQPSLPSLATTIAFSDRPAYVTANTDVVPTTNSSPSGKKRKAKMPSQVDENKPQKMLRLNAMGKLSSPVSRTTENDTKYVRGKDKKPATKKGNCIVPLQYGRASPEIRISVGDQIDRILAGSLRSSSVRPYVPPESSKSAKPSKPPKPTHPFFGGLIKGTLQNSEGQSLSGERAVPSVNAETKCRTPKKSAVTPGKLRKEVGSIKSYDATEIGFRQRTSTRYPGSCNAPWPWKGIAHIRVLNESATVNSSSHFLSENKKRKQAKQEISTEENILIKFSNQLRLQISSYDEIVQQHHPMRRLMTGVDIKHSIQAELSIPIVEEHQSQQSLVPEFLQDDKSPHPALLNLWRNLENAVSLFDKSQCEKAAWTVKYAPQNTGEILTMGKEPAVLRNWLKGLTVSTVQNGMQQAPKIMPKKPKKRKRATDDLDSFIVHDGEEDMSELTDPDDVLSTQQSGPKSIIQIGTGRSSNAVLISGPCGCGKSAAIYAIAKELDFEVFEINSASRRSGKDILEKIGDMTENHLVQSGQAKASIIDCDTLSAAKSDLERNKTACKSDTQSGRQNTMTSFLKTAGSSIEKARLKGKGKEKGVAKTTIHSHTQNKQKQSLILFEEVDVLFDEDKTFWSTVISLATQSKRPIIMTCNDESLIPVDDLSLHAILRFSSPPEHLVIDYLLLIAANEGHLLHRQALQYLYQSKGYDFRASLTNLDFWCQLGIGDRKGGLEWMLQRWPPGSDLDSEGRILRVVSEGTYTSGMGFLGSTMDPTQPLSELSEKEESLKELWDEWNLAPSDSMKWESSPRTLKDRIIHGKSILDNLRTVELACEAASAADVFSRTHKPIWDSTNMTLPWMTEKHRQNYTSGIPLIQTDHAIDSHGFGMNIAVSTHLLLQTSKALDGSYHLEPSMANSEADLGSKILASKTASPLPSGPETQMQLLRLFEPIFLPPITPFTPPVSNIGSTHSLPVLVTDVAPYVRSIVAYDLALEARRARLNALMSERVQEGKVRKTRASRSALEGSMRATTRRERWFGGALNLKGILNTGGEEWEDAATILLRQEEASISSNEIEGTMRNMNQEQDEMHSFVQQSDNITNDLSIAG